MAEASDARLAKGEGGPLEGLPIGVKDLYATEGVHTQACSHILDGFKPPYESTVTANLWRDGAVMLGKLNMDEFAMGSSNETSYYGPVASPWLPPNWSRDRARAALARRQARAADAGRLVGRLRGGGRRAPLPGRDGERHRRLDPPARRLHRHRRHQADLRPLLALRHGRVRLVARSGGAARAHRARRRDHAALDGGPDPKDSTCSPAPVPDYEAAVGRSVKGMTIGVPKEYRLDGMNERDRGAVGARRRMAARRRRKRRRREPAAHAHTRCPLIISSRPRRPRAISRATTACATACASRPADIVELYEKTRARGFGPRCGGGS